MRAGDGVKWLLQFRTNRAPEPRRKAPIKTPKRILPLVEEGLVDEVIRQLMSGKEAVVYVVRCGHEVRCAKVYKEPEKRAFRQAVDYTQGRYVKQVKGNFSDLLMGMSARMGCPVEKFGDGTKMLPDLV